MTDDLTICDSPIVEGDVYLHVRKRDDVDFDRVGVIHASHFYFTKGN